VTLILTTSSADAVNQVTDRLVTQKHGPDDVREWDPTANKTLIFAVRDAVVCMAYTGTAIIDGLATDEWLARRLLDRDEVGPGISLNVGGMPDETIGQTLGALCGALRSRPPLEQPLTIVAAGYQCRRGRTRPVIWTIDRRAADGNYGVTQSVERHPPWPVQLLPVPSGNLDIETRTQLLGTAGSVEDLVAAIRTTSGKANPYVGPHCMAVSLNPRARTIDARFVPSTQTDLARVDWLGDEIPAAYLPWVLGRGLVMSPQILVGQTLSTRLDDWSVRLHAAPPTPKLSFYMMTQPRRRG
jgi:hypothetical protein